MHTESDKNCTQVNTPRVSVVMGIYNCETTLRAAIESIIGQSFTNWELIICDDASTDNSLAIAQSYTKQDKRIIVIHNSHNVGCNIVLNNCLAQAKGEYIAIMDSDDISHPLRLEKEVNILENNPQYTIVGSALTHFDEGGSFMTFHYKERPRPIDLVNGIPHGHPTCMIRHKALKEINGYYTEKGMERIEDYYMMARLYALGYRGYNLQEPLLQYCDDRKAYARRTWQTRLNEWHTYNKSHKLLHQPFFARLYLLRPLLVGLLPRPLYNYLHRRRGNRIASEKGGR